MKNLAPYYVEYVEKEQIEKLLKKWETISNEWLDDNELCFDDYVHGLEYRDILFELSKRNLLTNAERLRLEELDLIFIKNTQDTIKPMILESFFVKEHFLREEVWWYYRIPTKRKDFVKYL